MTAGTTGGYQPGTINEQNEYWVLKTGKGLKVTGYDHITEDRCILTLIPAQNARGPIDEQYQEAKQILLQKFDEKLVDEMIAYAKQRVTDYKNAIEDKVIEEGKYRIRICPENTSDYSNIMIFLK